MSSGISLTTSVAWVKRGVAAAQLDSSLSMAESRAVKDSIRDGSLKLLFVAPERLNNEAFMHQIRDVKISLLAVDEARASTIAEPR